MAKPMFAIELIGEKELRDLFRRLPGHTQRVVVRGAISKATTKVKRNIVRNAEQIADSGNLARGWKKAKAVSIRARNKDIFIGRGLPFPPRSAFGIPLDTGGRKHGFYPIHVEFGTIDTIAQPYIRPAIDEHAGTLHSALARDIGKGIERQAKRLAAKGLRL